MKKSVKIIILILAIVLIGAIVFDVTLVNNAKTGNEKTASTAQTVSESTTKAEKTYSDPVEAQAREMIKNMTLYDGKVAVRRIYSFLPQF